MSTLADHPCLDIADAIVTCEIAEASHDMDSSLLLALDFHVWPHLGAPPGADHDRAAGLVLRAIAAMTSASTPSLPSSRRTLYGSLRGVYERSGRAPDAAYREIVRAMEAKCWCPSHGID